ncbi:MAG TPA: hypothetical protein VGE80_09380, partial [Schlesneria sp.]
IDERDISRFQVTGKAMATPRGASNQNLKLEFVRVEPYVIPKRAFTGDNTERIDTRVLQILYEIDEPAPRVYVGQQLDVSIECQASSSSKAFEQDRSVE